MTQDGGGWSPERPTLRLEGWDFEPAWPPQGEGLEIELKHMASDSVSYAFVMKSHWKLWTLELCWTQWCARKGMHADSTGRGFGSSAFGSFLDFTLCLFIWLVLICILYQKSVFQVWCFSELWVLVNYRTWRRSCAIDWMFV